MGEPAPLQHPHLGPLHLHQAEEKPEPMLAEEQEDDEKANTEVYSEDDRNYKVSSKKLNLMRKNIEPESESATMRAIVFKTLIATAFLVMWWGQSIKTDPPPYYDTGWLRL
jgi:hypothetical protein